MTLQFFCLHCGIKTEGNTTMGITKDFLLECPCCEFSARFYIMTRATKTDEEVEAAFQNTPLTDSQRGTKKRFTSQSKT